MPDARRFTDHRVAMAPPMVEHEAHHRGQTYLMLRLLDVPTPAIFGLTSEEVLTHFVRMA